MFSFNILHGKLPQCVHEYESPCDVIVLFKNITLFDLRLKHLQFLYKIRYISTQLTIFIFSLSLATSNQLKLNNGRVPLDYLKAVQ